MAKLKEQERKELIGTAIFVKPQGGFRGKQTALYKLSTPYEDYDYLILNTCQQEAFVTASDTAVYGSNQQGQSFAEKPLHYFGNNSHTETLANLGYGICLSSTNPDFIIDRWEFFDKALDELEITRSAKDVWACSCPPWVIRPDNEKRDCKHIKEVKKIMAEHGIQISEEVQSEVSVARTIRVED